MIAGLPLGFAQPLVLLGLLSLPVLWWLLRLMPPRPRRIRLPADAAAVRHRAEGRDAGAHAVVADAAAPDARGAGDPRGRRAAVESAARDLAGVSAPLALLIDDGWAAAATWDARVRTAEDLIARAETDSRGVAIIAAVGDRRATSRSRRRAPRACGCASSSRSRTRSTAPRRCRRSRASSPRTPRRRGAVALRRRRCRRRARSSSPRSASCSQGKSDHRGRGRRRAGACARRRRQRGRRAHREGAARRAAATTTVGIVRALDLEGPAARRSAVRLQGATSARPRRAFDLPVEIRNDIARLEIAAERSAGAVQLLDKRWRRRTVGVVTGATADTAQPLLASTYLSLARAQPVRRRAARRARLAGARRCEQFLDQNLPMLILADVGNVAGEARERLAQMDRGRRRAGALRRPAACGRRRRSRSGEAAPRRPHARRLAVLGAAAAARGVLARKPVRRHAGAERRDGDAPGAGRARLPASTERTWATLADGTPLVTAARRGKGVIVLFHVTADTRWSDLPLSGAFVDMLKRIVALAGSTVTAETIADAQARARSRAADPRARRLRRLQRRRPRPRGRCRPDYQRPRHRRSSARLLRPAGRAARGEHAAARRPARRRSTYAPLSTRGVEAYRLGEPQDLRGPLFLGALALLVIDALVVFWLAGGLYRLMPRRRAAASALALGFARRDAARAACARAAHAARAGQPAPIRPPTISR